VTLASWPFAALLAVTLAAWWLSPRAARPWVMLAASAVFYAWAFPLHLIVLAGLVVLVWRVGASLQTAARPRRLLGAGITLVVTTLAVFKYTGFLVGTADMLFARAGLPRLPVPAIAAPLGISFVAFCAIHYLVETYRGTTPPGSLLETAVYLAFFPTVTAGPIKRWPEFARDLREGPARPDLDDLAYGGWRIVAGLAKKLVVADTLAILAVPLLAPAGKNPLVLLVGMYAYTMRIYFDFAGYSDIAIGVARLFGFRVMENFRWPYLRRNISEFWANWHASLTRFITEYVFIPLGGSRAGRARTALNTLAAMAVSGLWHGAGWHFVAWGLYHGAGLVVARWWREALDALAARWAAYARLRERAGWRGAGWAAGTLLTFNFVAFGWMLFLLPLHDALFVWKQVARFALLAARRWIG